MPRAHMSGYLLVEVTVALLLTATAMAGLTRWQLWALQDNHLAWQQTQAALLLDDLAQRLLLQWAPVEAYLTNDVASSVDLATVCPADCKGLALANRDLALWWLAVIADPAALPEPQACLRTTGNRLVAGLSWRGSGQAVPAERVGPTLGCLAQGDGRHALTIGLAL
jgi:hypothetical protein